MLIIRADGNKSIGTGHIMRCLSIAAEAVRQGIEPVFITAGEEMSDMIRGKGYRVYVLGTEYTEMEAELPSLAPVMEEILAQRSRVRAMLVDSYFVTPVYLEEIKKWLGDIRLVLMDDLLLKGMPVDGIINYNLYGKDYPAAVGPNEQAVSAKPELYLGTGYMPLREQFCRVHKNGINLSGDTLHILVMTGGADPLNVGARLVRACVSEFTAHPVENKNIVLHVVCGAVNPNRESLEALEREINGSPESGACINKSEETLAPGEVRGNKPFVSMQLHVNVENMAELMTSCDAAVTAGGSTFYELCAVGTPFCVYSFVDNQLGITGHSSEVGVVNAGDFRDDPELVEENTVKELRRLLTDRPYAESLQKQITAAVDGRGAERIVKAICLRL